MPNGPTGAPQRYALLESARDFAAQQLDATGESAAVLQCHAEVVASTFDRAWEERLVLRDVEWSTRYLPERGNVAAALAWACQRDEPALLARLVAAYATLDGFADKESALVQAGVPLEVLRRAPPPLRALACAELGWALFLQGSRELGTELLEQALHDSEATQDLVGIYLSLMRLIRLYMGRRGLQPGARALWERLSGLEASGVPLKLRLSCECTVARHFDPECTLERLQQSYRIALRAGFETQAVTCLTNITDVLLRQGRFEEVLAF